MGLLQKHYSMVCVDTAYGTASESLFTYWAGKQNAIVVMGAFETNPKPHNDRQNTAETLVKTITLPLFVAHQF